MTVEELIKILSVQEQSANVFIKGGPECDVLDIHDIEVSLVFDEIILKADG